MRVVATIFLLVLVVSSALAQSAPQKEQKFTPDKNDPLARPIADPVDSFLHPTCETLPKAVNIRGLRIGDDLAYVKNRFPFLKPHRTETAEMGLSFSLKPGLPRPATVSGVSILDVQFAREKAISISAAYEPSNLWANRDQFAGEIARQFGLPSLDHWLDSSGMLTFRCQMDGIAVAFAGDYPTIILIDEKTTQALAEQKAVAAREAARIAEEEAEKRRQKFKP
jgi:hypothetical protein